MESWKSYSIVTLLILGTSNVIEIKDVPTISVVPLLIPPNPSITSGKSTLNPYIYTYAAHPSVVSINALFAYRCNIPNAIKFKDV